MSQHDQTTPLETGPTESDDDAQRRNPDHPDQPTQPAPPVPPVPPVQPDAAAPYRGSTAVPEFRSGPAPTTSVVGLLGLLTTIAVLVSQATDLDIPWGVVGPVAVVGAGVLLVVLGLAGLRGQRFRG
ncbi:hypothetical protein [Knoellia aerolata]|uniref:Uncharacterized protein n=1 Tax=Knoellia aerolata DSM 18566 TaxID=1385519 RepID=A0A0A0JTH8_9MICO|nr:hypothetical protein [Knoellia aerolata]KGN39984.1 hypothetical protein N801_17600 [Knoellia aerolata DSM 18566]